MSTVYLIDGSGFIFRAFYSFPPMIRSDHTPVNAVYGFTSMILNLLKTLDYTYIGIFLDHKRQTFRQDLYPPYKQNRSAVPPDLIPQFPLIRHAIEALGIVSIELEGYEADDLIALYTRLFKQQGHDIVIVSSDKDLMQLIDNQVRMFNPSKNEFIDAEDVYAKFHVSPQQMIDLQALMGDATDNIPGIPGIGPKTGASLLQKFQTLENIFENIHTVTPPRLQKKLKDNQGLAEISKKLVTLADDFLPPYELEVLKKKELSLPLLFDFLQQQDFKSLIKKLSSPSPNSSAPTFSTTSPDVPASLALPPIMIETRYEAICDLQTLQQWKKDIQKAGYFAFHTITTGLDPFKDSLIGFSFSYAPGKAGYVPIHRRGINQASEEKIPQELCFEILKEIFEDPSILKIGHDIKYDLHILAQHSIHATALEDTLILSCLLDGSRQKHDLQELSMIYSNHSMTSLKELCGTGTKAIALEDIPLADSLAYGCENADFILRIYRILKSRLIGEKLTSVYEYLERPLLCVLLAMEIRGVKIDVPYLKSLREDFQIRLDILEKEIYHLTNQTFNLASSDQLGEILFQTLHFPHGEKTPSGKWRTDISILNKLSQNPEDLPGKIIQWRQLTKLQNTYVTPLPTYCDSHDRIHTSYTQAITSTGRLSSIHPNLQNIPIRTKDGEKLRNAFVAPEGSLLVSADYSQIELRVLAHMANIPDLKRAFFNNEDIHSQTAMSIFQLPQDQISPQHRRRAKTINFGIIYGITAFGLAQELKISRTEAKIFIDLYFEKYPQIQTYITQTLQTAKELAYVKTLTGRKCYLPHIHDSNANIRNFATRAAINAPIQGSASDIIKKAMIQFHEIFNNTPVKMILQVHDELVFEIPQEEKQQALEIITHTMENIYPLSVPLKVDIRWGKTWKHNP